MKPVLITTEKDWPAEIIVEPARLAMGIWGDAKGDICAAYCADTFPKIKVFSHGGRLFTNLGGGAEHSSDGYPLIPAEDYDGPALKQYTYEGREAAYKGRVFNLGPKVNFTARERTVEEWADLLRRQYAHGGYFAAGKTYAQVLQAFRDSNRISDNERAAIDAELRGPNLPETQSEMLKRLRGEGRIPTANRDARLQIELTLEGI